MKLFARGASEKAVMFRKEEECLLKLHFAVPTTKLEVIDFMLSFQLLIWDIKAYHVPRENFIIVKNKLQGNLSSFDSKIKSWKIKSNLSKDETKALRNLKKQKDVILQKADKVTGNPTVILDKQSYNDKMKELLHATTNFEIHESPPDNHLSFIINS